MPSLAFSGVCLQAKQQIPVLTATSLAPSYTYLTEMWTSLLIIKLRHFVDFFKNGEKRNCEDIKEIEHSLKVIYPLQGQAFF